MTVQQLIQHLQTVDPQLRVFVPGYEGGLNDIIFDSKLQNVQLNKNNHWYYGAHEQSHIQTESTIPGIVLYGENKNTLYGENKNT